jgi:hypothetical protein
MKKPYCCEASRHLFDQYYTRQQRGGGGDSPFYVGIPRQRGHGIANIFRSLWRFISPAVKSLTPYALRAGANIVEDVSTGKKWKDSTYKHVPSVISQFPDAISRVISSRRVISDAVPENINQSGSGTRKRRRSKKPLKKKKRVKLDIFS